MLLIVLIFSVVFVLFFRIYFFIGHKSFVSCYISRIGFAPDLHLWLDVSKDRGYCSQPLCLIESKYLHILDFYCDDCH